LTDRRAATEATNLPGTPDALNADAAEAPAVWIKAGFKSGLYKFNEHSMRLRSQSSIFSLEYFLSVYSLPISAPIIKTIDE